MATARRRSRKRRGEKREPRRNVCGASCGNVISRHVAIGEAFRLVPSLPFRGELALSTASRKCQAEGIVGTRRPPPFSNPRSNTRFLVFLATLLWIPLVPFYLSLSLLSFSPSCPPFFFFFTRAFARFIFCAVLLVFWLASISFYFNVFFFSFLIVCLIVWLIRVFSPFGMFDGSWYCVSSDCKSFFLESDE